MLPNRFERIHRSNLVGMGVMPLVFEEGTSWQSLGLKGDEQVTIRGLHGELKPHQRLIAEIVSGNGTLKRVPLICRIDTLDELDYSRMTAYCSTCCVNWRVDRQLVKDLQKVGRSPRSEWRVIERAPYKPRARQGLR